VPVFVQNEALFEKIVALFEKKEATFEKQVLTMLPRLLLTSHPCPYYEGQWWDLYLHSYQFLMVEHFERPSSKCRQRRTLLINAGWQAFD
jgi:hypothetical protein